MRPTAARNPASMNAPPRWAMPVVACSRHWACGIAWHRKRRRLPPSMFPMRAASASRAWMRHSSDRRHWAMCCPTARWDASCGARSPVLRASRPSCRRACVPCMCRMRRRSSRSNRMAAWFQSTLAWSSRRMARNPWCARSRALAQPWTNTTRSPSSRHYAWIGATTAAPMNASAARVRWRCCRYAGRRVTPGARWCGRLRLAMPRA